MKTSRKHIESLDGLRGIAILLVFLYHYLPRNPRNPLSLVASIGWTGVDLFFVLSGFLITGILYDSRGSSNFFSAFYARRALRLFPLYFFAVSIVLCASLLLRTKLNWTWIPYYFYGANVMLALGRGVPDFTPYFQCVHFWSLAVEEQFYSLWPLVLFFVAERRSLIRICMVGIFGALICRTAFTHFGTSTWLLYSQLPTRMDALLLGALFALVLRAPTSNPWINRDRLYPALLLLTVILALLFAKARSFFLASSEMTSCGYSVIAGIYVCLLALAITPGTLVSRIGRLRVLRFFGRYSYGLYIWHDLPSPVCVTWLAWFTSNVHPLVLAQLVYVFTLLSLFTLVAYLSYHTIEKPFLRLKRHFEYRRPEAGFGAAAADG